MSELENKNASTTPENAAPAASTTPTPATTPPVVTPTPVAASPVIQAPIIKSSPSKGKKLSPMKLAIGCVIFFMMFIALTMAAGYA